MKIYNFSINDYRSITRAYKVRLYDKSILIGPNNEGKSNILRGLVLTLQTLSRATFGTIRSHMIRPYLYRENIIGYDWEKDFPVRLQKTKPDGSSEFIIEFELTESEKEEFKKLLRCQLSTNLILRLNFYNDRITFDVVISGPAKKVLEKKYEIISNFLRDHINSQYIPAVRTTSYAIDIVENLLARALWQLEEDPKYKRLIDQIEERQKPILKTLATGLTTSIKEFVPAVKEVELNTSRTLRRAIRQSCRVLVDDGIKTDMEQKGDGIKSLIAISLVKHVSKTLAKQRNIILAIEEPESHLHPEAIHRLSTVLSEISLEQQVIITTHSPLLVDRINVENNIVVYKSKAKAAIDIAEIRDILGVQVSDNLSCANWVLLVEGEEDKKIIKTWITELSSRLKTAFETGRITIDDLQGSTNLSYKSAQYKSLLCNIFVYLDNDSSGNGSFEKAKTKGLIDYHEAIFAICPGKKESEIEDLIVVNVYTEAVQNKFGVRLQGRLFKNNKKIWSERVADVFRHQGRPWNKNIEAEVKKLVAECAAQAGIESLQTNCGNSVKVLVSSLEERLKL